MASRLTELDRVYRRRMSWTLPGAAGIVVAAMWLLGPVQRFEDIDRKFASLPGPLEILPQIDIAPDPENPRRETAAPILNADADFIADEIRIVDRILHEVPDAIPKPLPSLPDPGISWTEDDLQNEIRTTGLPVLGRADFVVVHFERPVYPREALLQGTEGMIEAMLLVDTKGRVREAYILEPGRFPLLESATVDALELTLFRPYLQQGRATPFWVRIPVDFRLVN